MRAYLLLGVLFLVIIWDIAQNQGRTVRLVGAWFANFMRAVGLL